MANIATDLNMANRQCCDLDIRDYKTKAPWMFADFCNTTTANISADAVYANKKGVFIKEHTFLILFCNFVINIVFLTPFADLIDYKIICELIKAFFKLGISIEIFPKGFDKIL